MATKNLFPAIRPSLNLDFTKGFVDPRITFTRASTATRIDSKGLLEVVPSGVPRLDYAPVTRVPKGLLIEEQRTNLLTYSEQFDNVAWVKTNATLSKNIGVSPDGTSTADLFEATSSSSSYAYQGKTLTQLQPYSVSVYVKNVSGSGIVWLRDFTEAGVAKFDLLNATAIEVTGIASSAMLIPLANGWFRLSAVFTPTVVTATHNISCAHPGGGLGASFYVWGAQLEVGAFPTSYIPTTTAAVTRAADAAVMTGSNFSSWYRQDEGSFYAEGMTPSTSQVLVAADDGSMSNRYQFTIAGSYTPSFAVAAGGAISADLSTSSAEVGSLVKSAGAYRANDFALSANGGVAKTDTSGVLPTSVSNLRLGAWSSGAGFLNGHIRRITYYPRRLSNAELQALTA